MGNALLSWEVAGQALVILGTGGWLAYVIKDHSRRLAAIEMAVGTRASATSLEALEDRMPEQLQTRLRALETEKLNVRDHAAYCAASLKTVEVMVKSIKEAVENHAQRLENGDRLFRELTSVAAELRASLNNAKRNGHCPFQANGSP
jgi:chromosome segregation ATPase